MVVVVGRGGVARSRLAAALNQTQVPPRPVPPTLSLGPSPPQKILVLITKSLRFQPSSCGCREEEVGAGRGVPADPQHSMAIPLVPWPAAMPPGLMRLVQKAMFWPSTGRCARSNTAEVRYGP